MVELRAKTEVVFVYASRLAAVDRVYGTSKLLYANLAEKSIASWDRDQLSFVATSR